MKNKNKIILVCEICYSRNYNFFRNTVYENKVELKKFCSNCNKHTLHKETR